MKKNTRIREYARAKGVRLWEIAEKLNVSEWTFVRKLRSELSPDFADEVMTVIDRIAEEHAELTQGG